MRLLTAVMLGMAAVCLGGCAILNMQAEDEWRNRGEFILRGDVLDDKGQPLQGVNLVVGKETSSSWMFSDAGSPGKSCEYQTVGPTFNVDCKGAGYLRLEFTKGGYRKELVVIQGPGRSLSEQCFPPSWRKPPKVQKEGLRVVLKATTRPADSAEPSTQRDDGN
jgi:hypothetical protein